MDYRIQQSSAAEGSCPDAQILARHIARPEMLSHAEREAVVEHLFVCPKCCDLYDILCDRAEQFHEQQSSAVGPVSSADSAMDMDPAKADFWRRVEAQASQDNQGHRHHLIYRIGKSALAAAACLLLALGIAVCLLPQGPGNAIEARLSRAASSPKANDLELLEGLDADRAPLASSEPFDPTKIDYEKWRDEHREWFAGTFPWIFEAQKALQAKGVQADYIELLMVSGDIWQFRFDPDGPIDQPLATCRTETIERLASHYVLSPESLRVHEERSQGHSDMSAVASLRRWRTATVSAARINRAASADLGLASLRAAVYLRDTRTAACVWALRNPHVFQAAMASDKPVGHDLPIPTLSVQAMSQQCTAAQQIVFDSARAFTEPTSACSGTRDQWDRISASLQRIEANGL